MKVLHFNPNDDATAVCGTRVFLVEDYTDNPHHVECGRCKRTIVMSCFWFGHALPLTERALMATIEKSEFKCSRCGKPVKWETQPDRIKKMRNDVLQLRKQQIN